MGLHVTTKCSAITETFGTELAFVLLHFPKKTRTAQRNLKKTFKFLLCPSLLKETDVEKRERDREVNKSR